MNRLLRVIVIVCVVAAPLAYADDIYANISYVTASMGPNAGSGDNISITLIGPGTLISAGGGMACWDWCSGDWVPNGTPVALSQVFAGPFYDSTVAGVTYDFGSLSIDCCLFSGANLSSSASGTVGSGDNFAYLFLSLPGGGSWNLQFLTSPDSFAFVGGTFSAGRPPTPVPEPSTLALIASGLSGILGICRKIRPLTN